MWLEDKAQYPAGYGQDMAPNVSLACGRKQAWRPSLGMPFHREGG